ncbi:hypothetical protein ACFQ9X_57205 [Catenulispora yoronensis]
MPAARPARGGSPAKPKKNPPAAGKPAGAGAARSYGEMARRIEAVVADLETMVAQLPTGTPSQDDARALRRAVGRLGAVTGQVKKATPGLGIAGGR